MTTHESEPRSAADKQPEPTKPEVAQHGLDSLDPHLTVARDAQHFRAVLRAAEASALADLELRIAVAAARAAGDSWVIIGAALGTTKQAAEN